MTTHQPEREPVHSTSPLVDDAASLVGELAALFAAGALTDPERIEVERRLADGDEALLTAVRNWSDVVATLGTAVEPVTPDPRIKSALLARLRPEPADTTVPVGETAASPGLVQVVHRADGGEWRSAGAPGASVRVLNADRRRGRMTTLMKIDPGCRFPAHSHPGDEECLVLSGDMIDGDLTLGPGDYVRSAAGTYHHELTTRSGCVCLLVSSMEPKLSR